MKVTSAKDEIKTIGKPARLWRKGNQPKLGDTITCDVHESRKTTHLGDENSEIKLGSTGIEIERRTDNPT